MKRQASLCWTVKESRKTQELDIVIALLMASATNHIEYVAIEVKGSTTSSASPTVTVSEASPVSPEAALNVSRYVIPDVNATDCLMNAPKPVSATSWLPSAAMIPPYLFEPVRIIIAFTPSDQKEGQPIVSEVTAGFSKLGLSTVAEERLRRRIGNGFNILLLEM